MPTTEKRPTKREVHVPLTDEAYAEIEQAAAKNRRSRGAEAAFRLEKQLRDGKDLSER